MACFQAGMLGDLYSFEREGRKWTRLSGGGGPPATFFPSFMASPAAGLLFTFGGDSDPRSLGGGTISISPAQPQNLLYTVPVQPILHLAFRKSPNLPEFEITAL